MSEKPGSVNVGKIFLNNSRMTVDSKLRVGIPERFIKVLKAICPDHADRVGVIGTKDHSLKLMPYPMFLERLQYLETLNDQIAEHRTILNIETSLAIELPLDAQNRIRLTPDHAAFCEIDEAGKTEALIVGKMGWMELFSPATFKRVMNQEMEKFAEASDRVAREAAGTAPAPQFVIEAKQKG